MVDCGATKCLQERKNIKKELLSWTKKIPLLIGLEEVTKVVLGKRLSRRVLDITHSEDGSRERHTDHSDCIKDWEPQENCTFCDKKSKFCAVDSPKYEHKEFGSAVYNDSSIHGILLKPSPQAVVFDSSDKVAMESECCDESLDPDQPLDLSLSSQKNKDESLNSAMDVTPYRSPNSKQNSIQLKVPTLEGKFPSTKKREVGNGQKRVYTEDELNAAVSDIRSGKIGTRRAAALYGIPRSTLRNKMCRMDLAESKSCSSPLPATATMSNGRVASPAARQRVRDMLQSGTEYSTEDRPEDWSKEPEQEDQETKGGVTKMRHKHDLSAGIDRPFGMPPLFYNSQYMLECERAFRSANPYVYDMKLPYLQDLIWRYAQERIDSTSTATAGLPTLQELKDYASHSRASNTDVLALDLQIPTLPSSPEYYLKGLNNSSPLRGSEAQDADHPLISPSVAQGNNTVPPANSSHIDNTLKDILTKSISEKMIKGRFNQPQPASGDQSKTTELDHHHHASLPPPSTSQPVFPGSNPYDSFYMMPNGYCSSSNGHSMATTPSSGLYDQPPPHKKQILSVKPMSHKGHQNKLDLAKLPKNGMNTVTASNSGVINGEDQKPLKKTRPKRGQYRKYNHELLMEAVRAVQRGEMSVHRAGSYYGVPHSTLEYKVKERHLLRQKKPREPRKKTLVNGIVPVDSPSVSASSSPVKTSSVPDVSPDALPTSTEATSVRDSFQQSSGNTAGKSRNNSIRSLDQDGEAECRKSGTSSSNSMFSERNGDGEPAISKYFAGGDLGSDQLQHATQSLQASLLLGSLGANGALPNLPLANSPFPLAFGWQNPLLNGNLPFPLPDAALAASLYGAGNLAINTSASELLKKLQQKVQAETSGESNNKGTSEKESVKTSSITADEKDKQKKELSDRDLNSMLEVAEKS